MAGNNPVLVAGNKVDLLPKDLKRQRVTKVVTMTQSNSTGGIILSLVGGGLLVVAVGMGGPRGGGGTSVICRVLVKWSSAG